MVASGSREPCCQPFRLLEAIFDRPVRIADCAVDHPEHAADRGIGLGAHDLFDQGHERRDAGWGFAIHLAGKDGYQDSILPNGRDP